MAVTGEFDNADTATILDQLTDFVAASVEQATSLLEFERGILDRLLSLGLSLTDQFLAAQPDGDQGTTVKFEEATVHRSSQPVTRKLRTVFGQHAFEAYVYRVQRNEKSAIAHRPVDQRLQIRPDHYSPLLQEFSMMLCVEQAFHQARDTFETMFRQRLSVDTLERVSRTMGAQAAEFIAALPTPDSAEEGEFLVATADGKGVPMNVPMLKNCVPAIPVLSVPATVGRPLWRPSIRWIRTFAQPNRFWPRCSATRTQTVKRLRVRSRATNVTARGSHSHSRTSQNQRRELNWRWHGRAARSKIGGSLNRNWLASWTGNRACGIEPLRLWAAKIVTVMWWKFSTCCTCAVTCGKRRRRCFRSGLNRNNS